MLLLSLIFFFNDTPTTEIYTLSLHDALPIYSESESSAILKFIDENGTIEGAPFNSPVLVKDRKSTRLNSSHLGISYAVFCLKKKKYKIIQKNKTPFQTE